MKKLMIFGGGGFVGGNMTRTAQEKGWKVCIADSFFRPGLENVEWAEADITDQEGVDAAFEKIKPDAAVNLAAIADIDKAEKDKEAAWKVNVEGAANIAASCARRGVKYVFFSSDAVFDGEGAGYTEEDRTAPVNYYGHTKAEAEKLIFTACPTAVIIRISLVIGFPVTGGNSFFAGLVKKLSEGMEIVCPPDEVRTPIDVHTLSECVLELAGSDFSGILHIGATDSISRFELTKKAAKRMGYEDTPVKLQKDANSGSGRAPRHKNGIICVDKARNILKTRLLSVDEALDRIFLTTRE